MSFCNYKEFAVIIYSILAVGGLVMGLFYLYQKLETQYQDI